MLYTLLEGAEKISPAPIYLKREDTKAMSQFKNFKEYLAERAKHPHGVTSDNKGFANRDYDGGLSLKPKPGKTPKPQAYFAPGAGKNPGLMTADGTDRGTPLGNQASPGINPKNAMPYGEKPADKTKKVGKKGKKKLPTKKAMHTEQFLNETRKLSDVQFTKQMLNEVRDLPTPKVNDLYGREFVPEPAQTMKYVAQLMLTNETIMRRMVRELKRNGGLGTLLAEVLQHPETYQELVEAVKGNYGDLAQRKLALLIEEVSPPRVGKSSGSQGGAFGGGGAGMGQPSNTGGISGGPNAGGGMNVNAGGAGGMQGMGEEEMAPGGGMSDGGGDIHPEDDHDDDDMHDDEDGEHDENGDDEGSEMGDEVDDDSDLADDDEDDGDDEEDHGEEDEEDDEDQHHDDPHGMGGGMPPSGGGMGMGGPGGM